MKKKFKSFEKTEKLVLTAILTALVILLQFMGSFIHLGVFSISLVLLPIVVGAATCGVSAAAWLGFIFGVIVLISGDATLFLEINIPGTIITVLLKGILAGLLTGLTYKLFSKKGKLLAVVMSAIICPIVNTGVFLLGCLVFFLEPVRQWGLLEGYNSVAAYLFLGFVGGNFLFEFATNIILSPIIVRLLSYKKIS